MCVIIYLAMKIFQIPTRKLFDVIHLNWHNEIFHAQHYSVDTVLSFTFIFSYKYYIHTKMTTEIQISRSTYKGIPLAHEKQRRTLGSEGKNWDSWAKGLKKSECGECWASSVIQKQRVSSISLIFYLLWPRSKWFQLICHGKKKKKGYYLESENK